MKLLSVYSIGFVLSAALALTPILTAQDKPLNMAEIEQLIARGQPADHARLSAHFGALAERYTVDGKRHAAMRPAFAGNTKLANLAASQAAHCQRLAARNEASASILRELAAHHSREAAGVASEPPRGSERFQGDARIPTDAELTRLAASAETAADHSALARYFTSIAEQYERESKESAAFARTWRGMTRNPTAPAIATRWERLAKEQAESAAEARAAAVTHRDHTTTAK